MKNVSLKTNLQTNHTYNGRDLMKLIIKKNPHLKIVSCSTNFRDFDGVRFLFRIVETVDDVKEFFDENVEYDSTWSISYSNPIVVNEDACYYVYGLSKVE